MHLMAAQVVWTHKFVSWQLKDFWLKRGNNDGTHLKQLSFVWPTLPKEWVTVAFSSFLVFNIQRNIRVAKIRGVIYLFLFVTTLTINTTRFKCYYCTTPRTIIFRHWTGLAPFRGPTDVQAFLEEQHLPLITIILYERDTSVEGGRCCFPTRPQA